MIIIIFVVTDLCQKALLLTGELNVPLHRASEINLNFPTMLVAVYLIWCTMGQNTGAGRAVSSVLSHPSLHVARVRRGPSESNDKRCRSISSGAFSIPVTCVYGGKSWGGGTFDSKCR